MPRVLLGINRMVSVLWVVGVVVLDPGCIIRTVGR